MRTLLNSMIPLIIICFICLGLKIHTSLNQHFTLFKIKLDSINYKVCKIDSINNYYIIYAQSGNKLFKIISPKARISKCEKIRVDKVYKFHLRSLLTVNGHSVIPANQIYEISGWKINDSTTIHFEGDSIRDLYYGDNIKGLCFIKKKK